MIRTLLLLLATTPVLADDELEELADLMDGTFTNFADAKLAEDGAFSDRRTRIVAPDIGEFVFYLQLNQDEGLQLYRQRVFTLERRNDRIEQRTYRLKSPEKFVDATADSFDGFSREDVEPYFTKGCEQVWSRDGDRFRGYVNPQSCRIISSRTGKPRLIEAENRLDENELHLAERGFDPDGKQLFGTPQGEALRLTRR